MSIADIVDIEHILGKDDIVDREDIIDIDDISGIGNTPPPFRVDPSLGYPQKSR